MRICQADFKLFADISCYVTIDVRQNYDRRNLNTRKIALVDKITLSVLCYSISNHAVLIFLR